VPAAVSVEIFGTALGPVLQSYDASGVLQGTWTLTGAAATVANAYDPGAARGIDGQQLDLGSGSYHLSATQLGRIIEAGALTVALDNSAFAGLRVPVQWVGNGGTDWLFVAAPAGGLYRFDLVQSAVQSGSLVIGAPADGLAPSRIDDMVHLASGGTDYLVTVSAADDAVTVWAVDQTGALSQTGVAAPGIGIDAPSAIAAATVSGEQYLVVAGSGSGSLSVFGLTGTGGLQLADHVLDDIQTTRFADAAVLETVRHGDRTYLLSAGSDQGISVLTLLPGGRLIHLASLGDSPGMTLDQVSGLTARAVNDTLQIFAVSGTEAGVTQLELDLAQLGEVLMGDDGPETLVGGAADDILFDGGGRDVLQGGAGADLFVFAADGRRDVILDFDPARDALDLSGWAMLHDVLQLQITPTVNGARLTYRDEVLEIHSVNGTPLSSQDIGRAGILNLDRPPLGLNFATPPQPTNVLEGTNRADRLIAPLPGWTVLGKGDDDVLASRAGHNVLNGGTGQDCVDYSAAEYAVTADLGSALAVLGPDWSDQLIEIEHLIGTAYHDLLTGNDMSNNLSGEAGADQVWGGGGDDFLSGGTGADTLWGGADDDTLYGNTSTDELHGEGGNDELRGGDGVDMLSGGPGDDFLIGHSGWDQLFGDAGDDTLYGSSGDDILRGGTNNDFLSGGSAVDHLYGNAGNDTLYGNFGADELFGGAGGDELFGGSGIDTLRGGDGDDTLYGNEGADTLFGGDQDDALYGGTGDDGLYGEADDDALYGGQGVDTLEGGTGNDFLRGGTHADTFVFADGDGIDEIDDFATVQDILMLDDAIWGGGLTAQQVLDTFGGTVGGLYVLDFLDGQTITFNTPLDPADLVGQITIV
jgi:Ca2+-binding RTX toxin-like protein